MDVSSRDEWKGGGMERDNDRHELNKNHVPQPLTYADADDDYGDIIVIHVINYQPLPCTTPRWNVALKLAISLINSFKVFA